LSAKKGAVIDTVLAYIVIIPFKMIIAFVSYSLIWYLQQEYDYISKS